MNPSDINLIKTGINAILDVVLSHVGPRRARVRPTDPKTGEPSGSRPKPISVRQAKKLLRQVEEFIAANTEPDPEPEPTASEPEPTGHAGGDAPAA